MSRMYRAANKIIEKNTANPLPSGDDLSNQFDTIFEEKIRKVRHSLDGCTKFSLADGHAPSFNHFTLIDEQRL